MTNNWRFYNFPRITVAVYFTEFESIVVIEALTEHIVCLKRPITSAFESSQPLLLYGVSAPSLHIESTDSMICVQVVETLQKKILMDVHIAAHIAFTSNLLWCIFEHASLVPSIHLERLSDS